MPGAGKYGLVISYTKSRRRHHVRKRKSKSLILTNGDEQLKGQHMLACRLCNSSDVNDLDLGEILTNGDVTVHYFCLLLASGLYQNGRMSDKKAIKGFLKQDILKEVKRGGRLKCCYCHRKGATIGCTMSACKRVFHLPCGRVNGALHQFFDTFGSFCEHHRPEQRRSVSDRLSFRGTAKATCAICLSAVDARSSTKTIRSPCCKNSWFHRNCIQNYAVSAGKYFFKCPLCSCLGNFQSEMLNFGIYIPVQDASWEMESNAYSELLERHNRCDALECICPEGRDFDDERGKFDLILCNFCGSYGTHVACKGLIQVGSSHICPDCAGVSSPVTSRAEVNTLPCEKIGSNNDSMDGIDEGRVLRSRVHSRSQQISIGPLKR